jgi:hypothetical protein
MIKFKAPTKCKLPTNREGLEKVWEEVKDLAPPRSQRRSSQLHQDRLDAFSKGGRLDIERTWIMRNVMKRKKELLSIQLLNLPPTIALKVIGCAMQKLPEDSRNSLLDGWKDYTLDDDYSQSTTSSFESIHNENIADEVLEDSDSDEEREYSFVQGVEYAKQNPWGGDSGSDSDDSNTSMLLEPLLFPSKNDDSGGQNSSDNDADRSKKDNEKGTEEQPI